MNNTLTRFFFNASNGGPRPWSTKAIKKQSHKSLQQYQRKGRREHYYEGLLKGETIFDTSLDRNEVSKDARQSARYQNYAKNNQHQIHFNEKQSRQQALIESRAYSVRQLNRVGREDRQSLKLEKMRNHHFPMIVK